MLKMHHKFLVLFIVLLFLVTFNLFSLCKENHRLLLRIAFDYFNDVVLCPVCI